MNKAKQDEVDHAWKAFSDRVCSVASGDDGKMLYPAGFVLYTTGASVTRSALAFYSAECIEQAFRETMGPLLVSHERGIAALNEAAERAISRAIALGEGERREISDNHPITP